MTDDGILTMVMMVMMIMMMVGDGNDDGNDDGKDDGKDKFSNFQVPKRSIYELVMQVRSNSR